MAKDIASFIRTYPGALPDDVCSDMLLAFESKVLPTHLVQPGIFDFHERNLNELQHGGGIAIPGAPKRGTFTDEVSRAMGKVKTYQKDCAILDTDWPRSVTFEKMKVKRFTVNVGGITRHVDANSMSSARRFMGFMICLNTIKDGGQIVFDDGTQDGYQIPLVRGTLILFPLCGCSRMP